jgi:SNF2 family DNA or RNA helicase
MWYDPDHDLMVYDVEGVNRTHLLQHIPTAKDIGPIVFPATFQNLAVARLCGLPVIRPLHKYDWPRTSHIKAPFHAQTETANFLVVHPRACVLSDMGTGKTLGALWAADALMQDAHVRGEQFRTLIVAPLSTLHTVWLDTIFANFMSRRKGVILHGSSEQRLAALAEPADFYILNHDGLKVGARADGRKLKLALGGFAHTLASRTDIRLVVVDEVGAFRDATSLRSKVARHVIGSREHLWLMTGTPIPNAPTDAYGIAKLLNNANGETFTAFKNRTMTQISQFKWVAKTGANDEAMKLLQPAIRFSIDDCLDLPELTMQTREVGLSADQTARIKQIKNDLILEMGKGTVTVANEAALRTKLLQIGCGAVYDADHKAHPVDCAPRLHVLRELIEEASGKVIVFAPFTSIVHMLEKALKDFTRCIILGDTPVKERTDIIHRFQQERDPHVLIAHPETISHGQTLTAAATTVWYGPTDKTDVYIQANKRMHRPGQQRPCTVVNLAGTGVEREIYRRLANNESQQGLLLKMVREQWI